MTQFHLLIGDKIKCQIGSEILIGVIIGFGTHKNQNVVDLDCNRFVYPHQILQKIVKPEYTDVIIAFAKALANNSPAEDVQVLYDEALQSDVSEQFLFSIINNPNTILE